jgi:hypothetical protein
MFLSLSLAKNASTKTNLRRLPKSAKCIVAEYSDLEGVEYGETLPASSFPTGTNK